MVGDNSVILKAINYIEDNLDRNLSLDEIAKKVCYSKFHLSRLFSNSVGCTIYKYIQARRLTKAAEKLVNTKKAITEIAYEANYDSQQSFTLAFRQLYICTPQKYRAIGIHIPKQKRFVIENTLFYKYSVKCGVLAA